MASWLFVIALSWLGLRNALEEDGAVVLLQNKVTLLSNIAAQNSCVSLTNHGSFFSAPVSAASTNGKFDIVIDTGSNVAILPSCSCSACSGQCVSTNLDGADQTTISYGSGDLKIAFVSDTLTVGSTSAEMHESLGLMLDKDLDTDAPINGILGLGPPDGSNEKGFLEEAGLDDFALCLNQGSGGSLVLSGDGGGNWLGSIGQYHWGLGLNGVSVGDSNEKIVCGGGASDAGSSTNCAAIPDSGSTAIFGPTLQVLALTAAICEQWGKCNGDDNFALMRELDKATKVSRLRSALRNCPDTSGMPSISFSVTGQSGQETLTISPSSYVIRIHGECGIAISDENYVTKKNGPLWILGLPLFFEYNVGYNIKQKSMSFSKGGCSGCAGNSLQRFGPDRVWETALPFHRSSINVTKGF